MSFRIKLDDTQDTAKQQRNKLVHSYLHAKMGILSFANTIHNVLFKMLHWLPASKRIDFRISIGLRLTFPLRKNPQPTCGSFVAMHEIKLPGEN